MCVDDSVPSRSKAAAFGVLETEPADAVFELELEKVPQSNLRMCKDP